MVGSLVLAACGSAPPTKAGDPTSTPTPATIDLTGWTAASGGTGPHSEIKNGRLELSMPWSSRNDQHPTDVSAVMTAPCQLQGDFEISAHYRLVTWPLTNGVLFEIWAGNYRVGRVSNRSGSEVYRSWLNGATTLVETRDLTGSMRLSRVGATITAYYKDTTGNWVKIGSANVTDPALTYQVGVYSDNDNFGKRDVLVAVDSLTVTGTKVSCG